MPFSFPYSTTLVTLGEERHLVKTFSVQTKQVEKQNKGLLNTLVRNMLVIIILSLIYDCMKIINFLPYMEYFTCPACALHSGPTDLIFMSHLK